MATTGTDVKRILEQKYDKTYSSFLNSTKQNDLLKESLFLAVERKYKTLSEQRDYDALMSAIKTNKKFAITGNQISIKPIAISNVTNVGTTITVTTTSATIISVGDTLTFAQVSTFTTTPAINGNSFVVVSVISPTQFTFVVSVFTSGTYVPNTGYITDGVSSSGVSNLTIGDYLHLLSVKIKYQYVITVRNKQLLITGATHSQPIVLTVSTPNNNLRTGELISTSGIFGNPNANGVFYIKNVGQDKVELYYDDRFLCPASGNGNYTGGGTISRIQYNGATPLLPNEKISDYDAGTIYEPKFERGNSSLKFSPFNFSASEISIDYIQNGIKQIDVADNTIDLEAYYPFEFLIYVCDIAVELFMIRIKDLESVQPNMIETEKAK